MALPLIIFNFALGHAATSEWHDLGGGKARLVASLDPATNKVSGILEVKLEPGWSTYWRYPGSSGIPPRLDFSSSQNFVHTKTEFPAPKLITQEYGKYAGYKTRVSFPFEGEIVSGSTGKLNLDLLIGVCAEICIPAQAKMSIPISELMQTDLLSKQMISLAKRTIPIEKLPGDIIHDIKLKDDETMQITVLHKGTSSKPELFVEGPSNWYLQPAALISQTNENAVFMLDISRIPEGTDPMSEKLRYTLVTGNKGIETTH